MVSGCRILVVAVSCFSEILEATVRCGDRLEVLKNLYLFLTHGGGASYIAALIFERMGSYIYLTRSSER